jgi:hypothetical protein
VQDGGKGEMDGYNDANENPDRSAAEAAVGVVAELYGRMTGRASVREPRLPKAG